MSISNEEQFGGGSGPLSPNKIKQPIRGPQVLPNDPQVLNN